MPFLTAQATPFAFLLSILFVFSQLSRFNELTAMKSVGIDFNDIVTPVLLLALFLSVFSFVLNETIVSKSYEKANYIKDVIIEK
jgi:lipopolysaccharide export system permease protein